MVTCACQGEHGRLVPASRSPAHVGACECERRDQWERIKLVVLAVPGEVMVLPSPSSTTLKAKVVAHHKLKPISLNPKMIAHQELKARMAMATKNAQGASCRRSAK